jgi:hypothetical protein
MVIMTVSFLVAFSNGAKIASMRSLGEQGYQSAMIRLIAEIGAARAWLLLMIPSSLLLLLSGAIILLDSRSIDYWMNNGVAVGFIVFPMIAGLHYRKLVVRLKNHGEIGSSESRLTPPSSGRL